MKKKGKIILWSSLCAGSLILTTALSIGTHLARTTFRTLVNLNLGTSDYEFVDTGDTTEDTEYFKKLDTGTLSVTEYDKIVAEELSAEGISLLENKNDALPLSKTSKVSLFGKRSSDMILCGGGSADISSVDPQVTLKEALESQNVSVNEDLWNLTSSYTGSFSTSYYVGELPQSSYSSIESTYSNYGDAAIIVIGRKGAELRDMVNYEDALNGDVLSLSQNEIDMFNYVYGLKNQGVFKKVIVVLNTTNAINFNYNGLDNNDFVEDFGVDSVIWMGYTGTYGNNSLAKIITGDINPSGSIVDTFPYDNKRCPAYVNFFTCTYANATNGTSFDNGVEGAKWHYQRLDGNMAYSIYSEGIYVGYRYFETRYEDKVLGTGSVGDYTYSDEVKYAFGTGLSYTTFSEEITNYTASGDTYTFEVKVTNTGDTAGKDTVQLYFQSPYTDYDQTNKIEKASIELCGFAKTSTLAAGDSETVTITVDKEELLAYDYTEAKTYILDAGDYYFAIGDDSHDALNNVLAQKGKNVNDGMTEAGDTTKVKTMHVSSLEEHNTSSTTGNEITNQFDDADVNYWYDEEYEYLTRSNWTGTYPEETTSDTALVATDAMKLNLFNYHTYESDPNSTTKMPTQGASGDQKLINYRGVAYDDESWDELLNQVTIEEMATLIGIGFHNTAAIPSVSKPATIDDNGPQGFTTKLIDDSASAYCAYTDENIMAATFNTELMYRVGLCMGNDMLNRGDTVVGLYGPAMNTHRTAYGGRNFEYYSEDGFLAGKIAAAEIKGIQEKGNYVYIKHFALNDQETTCRVVSTFANEQAIREIYLKPFQISIEEGGAKNVMNSFARFGTLWSGAHKGLMTNVLRGEWGMDGFAITDYNAKSLSAGTYSIQGYSFDVLHGLMAGTDTWDTSLAGWDEDLLEYRNDADVVTRMREATHRILYTVVNSHAMNGVSKTSELVHITPWWEPSLIAVSCVFGVFTGVSAGFLIYNIAKKAPSSDTEIAGE